MDLGGLRVRRMGFGARWIANAGSDEAHALLRRALELGVDFIDTADLYGGGWSERLIAEALHPYPEGLVIATKGGQMPIEGGAVPNGRPEYLRSACEASLERLRLECIDLYQIHCPDPEVPVEESLGALTELRAEGKVREIGLSNFFAHLLDAALACADVVSVQNLYNVFERISDHEIGICEGRGLAFLPWHPLARGDVDGRDGELERIAAGHGATPAQVALAWLLHRSPAMLLIPGTTSPEHLEENVAAAALRLGDDELRRLDGLSG